MFLVNILVFNKNIITLTIASNPDNTTIQSIDLVFLFIIDILIIEIKTVQFLVLIINL